MLRPKVTTLPGHIQAVYVQNMVKLYASILQQKERSGEKEGAQEITQLMIERLPQFVQSADLEVQERVREQNYFGIYHTSLSFVLEHICNFLWTCTFYISHCYQWSGAFILYFVYLSEREALELEWEEW